jgi:site-specific recombinase XerD
MVLTSTRIHAFRRTFALTLWRKGTNILSISRLLGHSSIEVTKRYIAVGNEDLQKAHALASPADLLLSINKYSPVENSRIQGE